MIEHELQRKIEDFRELQMPSYIVRERDIHLVDRTVSTIIGARRAGKSFRALQTADELLKSGFIQSLNQICLIDFDNPILSGLRAYELNLIQITFLKINPQFTSKTPLVFIFDEIHRISGWEEYVIDLSRNVHWKVIVTGSSSKLLKQNLSTALRGKAVSSIVFPLSFSEFLKFKGIQGKSSSTKALAKVRSGFDEYLKWGGYPALPFAPARSRERILREYFDTMILKDIIQGFDISKPRQCISLYRFLLSNISRPFTLKSTYTFLKQNGHATSYDAVRDYITYAQDAWFLFALPIHSDSQKKQERNYRKLYSIDWALSLHNSLIWDGSYAQALENMVYLHLVRKYPRLCYYLTRKKRQEVDFIVSGNRGKPVAAFQVCMDISHPETLRRETEPLVLTARYFKIKENFIITQSQEEIIKEQGVTVRVIPAWKWMKNL